MGQGAVIGVDRRLARCTVQRIARTRHRERPRSAVRHPGRGPAGHGLPRSAAIGFAKTRPCLRQSSARSWQASLTSVRSAMPRCTSPVRSLHAFGVPSLDPPPRLPKVRLVRISCLARPAFQHSVNCASLVCPHIGQRQPHPLVSGAGFSKSLTITPTLSRSPSSAIHTSVGFASHQPARSTADATVASKPTSNRRSGSPRGWKWRRRGPIPTSRSSPRGVLP